jgi:hypothetical protein
MPAKASVPPIDVVERFRPVRIVVRPIACTGPKESCWAFAGPVAIDSGTRCLACRGRPNLEGNERQHEAALAKILASEALIVHI